MAVRRAPRDAERGEIELEPMLGKGKEPPQLVALADTATRNGFVRKVYGLLGMQLVATVMISGFVVRHGHELMVKSPATVMTLMTGSLFMSLAVSGVFACCPGTMRRSPGNYGLMAVFTLAEGILVGFTCVRYTMGSVILCAGLTAMVVLGLTMYAMQSKRDFTGAGPYLFSALLVLCGGGLILSLMAESLERHAQFPSLIATASLGFVGTAAFGILQVLYAIGSALLFSFFIVYDTQLILGGGHQTEFSVDDYALAAVSLYLDVLQLFLAILRLLGREDDSGL